MEAIHFDAVILTNEGDTIKCQIYFADNSKYAYLGEILSTKRITALIDGEKITYDADELKYYSILMNDTWRTYWGVNTEKKKFQFMRKEVGGKLTLYRSVTFNSMQLEYITNFYFDKIDGTGKLYLQFNTMNNRKKLMQFIAECPAAASEIYSETIDLNDVSEWQKVAQRYNENC